MRLAIVTLAAVLVLAGCSTTAATQNTEIAVIRSLLTLAGSREVDPSTLDREVLHVDTVALPPPRAWVEVVRAWSTLRIPVTGVDTTTFRIGGSSQPMGLIGDSKPSAWLDCGHGMAEANADQYQVTFSMATRVMPLEGGSAIESIIRATARPRDVSTESFRCTSLGTLERRMAELIRQRRPGGS
jgi:hypothetical protein